MAETFSTWHNWSRECRFRMVEISIPPRTAFLPFHSAAVSGAPPASKSTASTSATKPSAPPRRMSPPARIQEFQIQQSSLDLSTELTSSGSVNVTTKSGTNDYHGEGYYYFRDQTLDANLPGGSDNYFSAQSIRRQLWRTHSERQALFLSGWRTHQAGLCSTRFCRAAPFPALTGSYNSPFREVEGAGTHRLADQQQVQVFLSFFLRSEPQRAGDHSQQLSAFRQCESHAGPRHGAGLQHRDLHAQHSFRLHEIPQWNRGCGRRDQSSSILFPGIELAIGSDPDCLTAGRGFFLFRA